MKVLQGPGHSRDVTADMHDEENMPETNGQAQVKPVNSILLAGALDVSGKEDRLESIRGEIHHGRMESNSALVDDAELKLPPIDTSEAKVNEASAGAADAAEAE